MTSTNSAAQISYRRIENATLLSKDTRNAIRDLPLFCAENPSPQDRAEPEGITALYERLSNEDKMEGESNSIANQKKILERYCREHGYTAIRHYDEDDGFTGTNFNRPGFQRMLADIKAGKIARVIVKDMSRFGRDYLQVGMFTDVIFPDFGVHFIAVNDGVDSTRGDNEFTAIRNVFNEMYARDTSKKLTLAWQNKGKSGEHLSTRPPYGYIKNPENPKRWIVDEEAAAVVQKIFTLCVGGLGPKQIAGWLRAQRILCPSAYTRSKGRKCPQQPPKDPCRWDSRIVSLILSRLEYLGCTVNFRTKKPSYKSKRVVANSPDEWAIFENTQEPIVEESVFMIVQNVRRGKKRPMKMGEMSMLSGLLFCGDCGKRMYQQRCRSVDSRQEKFICGAYSRDTKDCSIHSIRNVVLEEIILRNLREAISYVSRHEAEFIREASEIGMRARDREFDRITDGLAASEKRFSELDNIIKRLYEDNISGKLSDERFAKLSREYEQEQDKLKSEIKAARNKLNAQTQKQAHVQNFISVVKKYTDLKELNATILREFIDRIYIFATDRNSRTREIKIVYNFIGAFDFNADMNESGEIPAEHCAAKTKVRYATFLSLFINNRFHRDPCKYFFPPTEQKCLPQSSHTAVAISKRMNCLYFIVQDTTLHQRV
jgi:DNA invertase Pin-like site-specific DNA recombinase